MITGAHIDHGNDSSFPNPLTANEVVSTLPLNLLVCSILDTRFKTAF